MPRGKPAPMTAWQCPKCGKDECHPSAATNVMHRCKTTGTLVEFVKVKAATA